MAMAGSGTQHTRGFPVTDGRRFYEAQHSACSDELILIGWTHRVICIKTSQTSIVPGSWNYKRGIEMKQHNMARSFLVIAFAVCALLLVTQCALAEEPQIGNPGNSAENS